jgi:hypothetical protein
MRPISSGTALVLGVVMLSALSAAPAAAQRPTAESLASAVIAGQVVTADGGVPIRGAQVRLRGGTGGDTRLVTTDEQGRFEARNLFAGNWQVAVSKNGFVTARYGQRRASNEGTPIPLNGRQRADISIALQRAGAITGRVFDEYGEPLLGARVQALRPRVVRGTRQLVAVGASDTTDDTGSFRVFGLPPGTYYINAMLRGSTPDTDFAQNVLGTMTYYPGTADVGDAQGILLRAGEEANVAFQTAPVRSVRVSGIVLGANGSPAADTPVRLQRLDGNDVGTTVGNFGQSGPDGSFTIINVPPGPYSLFASRMGAPVARLEQLDVDRAFEEAAIPITVGTDDLTGITLVMAYGTTVRGTIIADTGTTLPSPLRVEITAASPATSHRNSIVIQRPRNAGQPPAFAIPGLFGPVTLDVELPDGLMLVAVEADGVDVTDKPIELRGSSPDVRIVVSTKVTEVSGVVTSGRTPVANVSVIVFPENPGLLTYPTRRIAFADNDAAGRFVRRRLPPNERYLAAVVTSFDDGDQFDPEFLNGLRQRATSLTLREGEHTALSLTLER